MARAWLPLVLALAGCAGPALTREELRDPASCVGCHADHVAQWQGSMHAYAGEDPVFRAMNARGQRDTGGALGDFCLRCHAPVALLLGQTTDGLNLDQVPASSRGVTCFFCHSVDRIDGDHNNPLHLADDGVLRAGIADPIGNAAHATTYSPLHDRQRRGSSALCGSCHDIVTPLGAKLERTFQEWQGTVYDSDAPAQLQTCGKCHMSGRQDRAADQRDAPVRTVHDHMFAGVDVALTPFPHADEQRAAIQGQLDNAIGARLCVDANPNDPTGSTATVFLDNVAVGHGWPSGSNQDRRAWVEVVAWKGGQPVYENGAFDDVGPRPPFDPSLWLFRDLVRDASGRETLHFWEVASTEPAQLPPAVTNDRTDPRFNHALQRSFRLPPQPDKVTVRVRLRAIAPEVLDDLVASGDLDPALAAGVPTYTLRSTVLEWTSAGPSDCVPVP